MSTFSFETEDLTYEISFLLSIEKETQEKVDERIKENKLFFSKLFKFLIKVIAAIIYICIRYFNTKFC